MRLKRAQQFSDEAMGRGMWQKVLPCCGWGGGEGKRKGLFHCRGGRCEEVVSKRQPGWSCLPPSFILTRLFNGDVSGP